MSPEEEGRQSDAGGLLGEEESREGVETGGDGEEEAITTHVDGGARGAATRATTRARAHEEELSAELESTRGRVEELELETEHLQESTSAESLRLQAEVSELEEKVKRGKEEYSALWRMNCERLVEHDQMISTKDEEINRLKARVRELELKPPVHVARSPIPTPSTSLHVTPATTSTPTRKGPSVRTRPVFVDPVTTDDPACTVAAPSIVTARASKCHRERIVPSSISLALETGAAAGEGPRLCRGNAPPIDAFTGQESPQTCC